MVMIKIYYTLWRSSQKKGKVFKYQVPALDARGNDSRTSVIDRPRPSVAETIVANIDNEDDSTNDDYGYVDVSNNNKEETNNSYVGNNKKRKD